MRNSKEFFQTKITENLDYLKRKEKKVKLIEDPFQEIPKNFSNLYQFIKENIVFNYINSLKSII